MSYGLCACMCLCWNGGDGPDQWCSDCRGGRHSHDREEDRYIAHADLSGAFDDQDEEET